MKILCLFRSSHPSISGADHMAVQTARALAVQTGVEVMLAQRFADRTSFESFLEESVMRIALPPNPLEAKTRLQALGFDRIHLFDFVDPTFLQLAKELKEESGCPLFVTPATDHRLWEDRSLGLEVCRLAEHVFALTHAERDQLAQAASMDPNRITVIPHAPYLVDAEQSLDFKPSFGIPEEAPVVLFLGRKLISKGYRLILEGSAELLTRYPETRFVFIGPDSEQSLSEFSLYRHETRILNLGFAEEAVKTAALQACDMLCLPSTVDVFPLVFLEAWANGKPVIASHQNGVEEIVRHEVDGLVVEPTPQAVRSGVERLLSSTAFARKLGKNGQHRTRQNHTWEAVANCLYKLYHTDEVAEVKPR